jgi:endonuclease-3 related protein
MPSLLNEVYDRLLARFSPQQWWPGETPFEVMLGRAGAEYQLEKRELAIANLRRQAF